MNRRSLPILLVSLAFLLSNPLRAYQAGRGPGELRPAERAALDAVLAFLEKGPEALADRLADDSPWKERSRADTVAELAARTGPEEGARWELQTAGLGYDENVVIFTVEYPSGLDEVITFELDGTPEWRIRELRCLADPPLEVEETFLDSGLPRGVGRGPDPGAVAWILGIASVLLLWRWTGSWRWAPLLGLAVLACRSAAPAPEVPSLPELAPLASYRAAWAGAGSEKVAPSSLEPKQERIRQLWEAQAALSRSALNEAEGALKAGADETVATPLLELLRARLAFLRSDREGTSAAYQRALDRGVDHDGLRLEMARADALLGHDIDAVRNFERLRIMGSRTAEVYYVLARLAVAEEDLEQGLEYLRIGWELEPMPRARIFADPILASLAGTRDGFRFLGLSSELPPVLDPPSAEGQGLTLPEGAIARRMGHRLELLLGESRLTVPYGGSLAPPGVITELPPQRRERMRNEALADLETLTEEALTPGALTQSALREEVEAAAGALADQGRWEELLEVTRGLEGDVEHVSPYVVQLRALALSETDREAEARALLVRLAKYGIENRRRDPESFYQLADVLAQEGEFDLAIRLIERANAVSPVPLGSARIRQLELEKDLATKTAGYETTHFSIRYPPETDRHYPELLGKVLEEERNRISRWVPLERGSERIEVDLFPLLDFLRAYSGSVLVVGLYDGRVQLPFADLESLDPTLVSILSHEVAHALIAQATDDHAPKWLHEGLAQHIQMVQEVINPIPELDEADLVLALTPTEEILGGFGGQQLVEAAYSQAAWRAHFLEGRFGAAGIQRLLKAYRGGLEDEAAIRSAFGQSLDEFDRSFVSWAKTEAPELWPTTLRRYDKELERESLVTLSRQMPRKKPGGPGKGELMARWYAGYEGAARRVKSALGPVLAALRGENTERLTEICIALDDAVRPMLEQEVLLAAPDAEVERRLTHAYNDLGKLTVSCKRGHFSRMRDLLAKAETELREAAVVMAPYGIAP